MPELPEVETTTQGLRKTIVGLTFKDVWTELDTKDKRKYDTIANSDFFKTFKKEITGKKVLSAERRAKNILINLAGGKTILIHMKMTGHLLYGKYVFENKKWVPVNKDPKDPLNDPFNRHLRVVFIFTNGNHLAFSDMRKFGKITLVNTKIIHDSKHLAGIGPEPLPKSFGFKEFKERLNKKPNGKIKTVLMDQSVIAGIGNIYSDEILWRAGVHPLSKPSKIPEQKLKLMFEAMKETLKKGLDFGGDSTSDYRDVYGVRGKFQLHHNAYQRTGERCKKQGCNGIIKRQVINGRSAHFCNIHQILFT